MPTASGRGDVSESPAEANLDPDEYGEEDEAQYDPEDEEEEEVKVEQKIVLTPNQKDLLSRMTKMSRRYDPHVQWDIEDRRTRGLKNAKEVFEHFEKEANGKFDKEAA